MINKQQVKGVCKITHLPPGMNVSDVRNLLKNYGVERIFLKCLQISKKKKRNYKKGYIEFNSIDNAQNAELVFNGRQIGGKKRSRFYDNFICLKYKEGLQWVDLLEKKEREKKIKEVKINAEIQQANKVHNFILGKKMQSQKVMKKILQKMKDDKILNNKEEALEELSGLNKAKDKEKNFEQKKNDFNKVVLEKYLHKKNKFIKKKPINNQFFIMLNNLRQKLNFFQKIRMNYLEIIDVKFTSKDNINFNQDFMLNLNDQETNDIDYENEKEKIQQYLKQEIEQYDLEYFLINQEQILKNLQTEKLKDYFKGINQIQILSSQLENSKEIKEYNETDLKTMKLNELKKQKDSFKDIPNLQLLLKLNKIQNQIDNLIEKIQEKQDKNLNQEQEYYGQQTQETEQYEDLDKQRQKIKKAFQNKQKNQQ